MEIVTHISTWQRYCLFVDVEELHRWQVSKCTEHPEFERLDDEEVMKNDPCVRAMMEETEEVRLIGNNTYLIIFLVCV